MVIHKQHASAEDIEGFNLSLHGRQGVCTGVKQRWTQNTMKCSDWKEQYCQFHAVERTSNQIQKLIKIHTSSQGLPTNWKKLWYWSSYKKQQYKLAISLPTSDQQRACLALSTATNKQGVNKHCCMEEVFKTKKLRWPFPTLVHTWRQEDKKLRYPFPTLVRTWRLQEQDASTPFSTLVRTPRAWTILTTIVQQLELLVSSWLLNTL